jgi:hypothetical protein
MTATAPSLSALHAAAGRGCRLACLALADVAEEAGDDALAGRWRWMAAPPRKGWEPGAWEVLRAAGVPADRRGRGRRISVYVNDVLLVARHTAAPSWDGAWSWAPARALWRQGGRDWRACPPAVRDAVLAACLAALSS